MHSVVLAEAVKKQDFRKVLELLDSEEAGRSFLLSALIKGWALAGEGRTEAAVAQFEKISGQKQPAFANYHKALLYLSKAMRFCGNRSKTILMESAATNGICRSSACFDSAGEI